MAVRLFQEKDRERVRDICIITANPIPEEAKGKNRILAVYCDYFINDEQAHCFVVVNEADEAIGYILCAPDYKRFRKGTFRHALSIRKQTGFQGILLALVEITGQRFFVKDYPALMHINIHPDYQRMGLGHQLVNALTNHLKENHIKGLKLIVGAKNETGKSFYKKYGFKVLRDFSGGITMGLKL